MAEIEKNNDEKYVQLSGCVIVDNGKILLLWKKKHNHYELPGGKTKENETIEQTARRETREEIGCDVIFKKYIGYYDFQINDKDYRSHTFIAEICKGSSPEIMEKDIFGSIMWMNPEEYKKYRTAQNVKSICEDIISGKVIL
jgi:8-oxo-dGTP diphosphatase